MNTGFPIAKFTRSEPPVALARHLRVVNPWMVGFVGGTQKLQGQVKRMLFRVSTTTFWVFLFCFLVFVSMSYIDIYGRCDLQVLNL